MSDQAPTGEQDYPGQRLGLPEEGSRSVAGWGRRIAALFLDWFACLFVANLITAYAGLSADAEPLLPLGVFLVEATLFTALTGGSFGQLALRVVIVRLDNRPVTVVTAFVRTLLICLLVPPVVFNRDNRGLHDLAVNTIALNR
jgi:uncharacterized RDD family membrane protein YckC